MAVPEVMPDIASELKVESAGPLDRVGMTSIELPIWIDSAGERIRVPAKADAFVSLDKPGAKGIHMSRLFLSLQEMCRNRVLDYQLLKDILEEFLKSHSGLSDNAYIRIQYELLTERAALVSGQKGWRAYPVVLSAKSLGGSTFFELEAEVLYSSTCPCSAALARQLIQENFLKKFGADGQIPSSEIYQWLGSTEGIIATPHSQRSRASLKVGSEKFESMLKPLQLIDLAELALKTPVQAAVKREDEQQFALLNGQNLMFCEDAARIVEKAFAEISQLEHYFGRFEHLESLHPHNATSEIRKGKY